MINHLTGGPPACTTSSYRHGPSSAHHTFCTCTHNGCHFTWLSCTLRRLPLSVVGSKQRRTNCASLLCTRHALHPSFLDCTHLGFGFSLRHWPALRNVSAHSWRRLFELNSCTLRPRLDGCSAHTLSRRPSSCAQQQLRRLRMAERLEYIKRCTCCLVLWCNQVIPARVSVRSSVEQILNYISVAAHTREQQWAARQDSASVDRHTREFVCS
jgi:hypothetical protein